MTTEASSINIKSDSMKDEETKEKEEKCHLKSCSLLYPELMKTMSATIEHQDRNEDIEEEAVIFEGTNTSIKDAV